MKIALVGYGSLGKQVENLFAQFYQNVEFFYFDDIANKNSIPNSFPFEAVFDDKFSSLKFFVSLGYKHLEKKSKIIHSLKLLGRDLITFVHPTVYLDKTVEIGQNVIVFPSCTLGFNVILDDGVLIYNGCILSHDIQIGKASFLAPGVVISGFVSIGQNCFIGSGSIISNNVEIGNNCVIGIGSVITNNLPDNSNAIGNPAKIVSNINLK